MTKATEASEIDAIKQVIAEGGAMDYVDVVDAVEKRFRIKTSSAKVEEVHRELVRSRTDPSRKETDPSRKETEPIPKPKVSLAMTSRLPSETATGPESPQAANDAAGSAVSGSAAPDDEMALGLKFVKAVGGLKHAKRILSDLESILRD